ncbi:MAG: hypothetical protein IJL99_01365 [Firmicutes bacterium]|nr:hypothetical protein [Bacillota bacterium]
MSTIAKWRKQKWLVSPEKIKDLRSLAFSYAQQADNNNSTEGKGLTNEKGLELFKMSFSTTLLAAVGVDVRKEINNWKKEVTKTGAFYLNGKQLGPKKMRLDKVGVSNILVDNKGRMLQATLQFNFVEDDPEKAADTSTSATGVKASKTDKEELKTSKTDNLETQGIKTGSYVHSTQKVDLDGNPVNTDDTMKVVSTKGGVVTMSGPNGTVSLPHNYVSLVD